MSRTKQNIVLKAVSGYEACISHIRRLKNKFKKQTPYPKGNYTVFKLEYLEKKSVGLMKTEIIHKTCRLGLIEAV
jgi:hypothetical protein